MRNSLYNDDLESYLQKQANQHRMYPSDRVWRNISKEIHNHKRWPALSAITVFIIAALVIGTLIKKPQPDVILSSNYKFTLPANSAADKNIKNNSKTSVSNFDEHLTAEKITKQTIAAATEKLKIQTAIANQARRIINNNDASVGMQMQSVIKNTSGEPKVKIENKTLVAEKSPQSSELTISETSFNTMKSKLRRLIFNSSFSSMNNTVLPQGKNVQYSNSFTPEINLAADENNYGGQSSALEKLKNTSSRFDFRFYITPSLSYRRLTEINESKSTTGNADVPYASNYTIDPGQAIRHRPAIGYETGAGLGYKLNDKFSLTGGVQFNISQYKVDAYIHRTDAASATSGSGNDANTVTTFSGLRSSPITLTNRYYELSIPLGVDWKAWTNGKFTWGVAKISFKI